MNLNRAAVVTLLSMSLAGCGGGAEKLSPPEVRLGVDACAACGMMLADARFVGALAFRDDSGAVQRLVYDDVGEMLAVDPPPGEHRFYVMAFDTGAWVPAEDATFVYSDSVMTPMATGVVAFADPTTSKAFAAAHAGVVMTLAQGRARAADGDLRVGPDARSP